MDKDPQNLSKNSTPPPFRPPATPQPATATTSSLPKKQLVARPTGNDPGVVLGVIGLVLAFFLSPVGLVLSIIARTRSIKAGFTGTLGTVGIVLNIIFMALAVLIIGIIIMAIVAFQGIQERAEEVRARSEIEQKEKLAEYEAHQNSLPAENESQLTTETPDKAQLTSSIAHKLALYRAANGTFPTSISQFSQQSATPLTAAEAAALSDAYIRTDELVINIALCDNNSGAYVEYWSEQLGRVDRQMVPEDANPAPPCSVMPLTDPVTP